MSSKSHHIDTSLVDFQLLCLFWLDTRIVNPFELLRGDEKQLTDFFIVLEDVLILSEVFHSLREGLIETDPKVK